MSKRAGRFGASEEQEAASRVGCVHSTLQRVATACCTPAACTASAAARPSHTAAHSPYQPNHRRKTPSSVREALWPGMSTGLPAASKRPMRGPSTQAAAREARPPTCSDGGGGGLAGEQVTSDTR